LKQKPPQNQIKLKTPNANAMQQATTPHHAMQECVSVYQLPKKQQTIARRYCAGSKSYSYKKQKVLKAREKKNQTVK
jgi:hypothetical protein